MRQIAVEAPTVSIVPLQSASALARVDPSADRPPIALPLRDVPRPSARRPAGPTGRSSRNTCLSSGRPAADIGRPAPVLLARITSRKERMNDNQDQMEPSTQTAGSGADWRTNWTPSRRRFLTLTGLALGGAALGLGASACGTAQTGSSAGQEGSKGRAGAAGETLFVAGFQWGPPKSFNPLAARPRLAH